MKKKKKIIIIGAGPGGLSSGMILAHRGHDVVIYEKEGRVGGRNGELEFDGFKFDIGPTFLMMAYVLEQIFNEAGRDLKNYLKLQELDPMYRLIFKDFSMDIWRDKEKMKSEIAKYFPGQEEGLIRFYKKEAKRFEKIYSCLEKEYSSVFDYLRPGFLKALPYIPFGRTIFEYLGNYFKSEKLRLAFTFQAKYLGMSAWECPAFFTILPYMEHAFGIYHVEGGLTKISSAMADVIKEEGGTIKLNSPVSQLIIKNKSVKGVMLADGSQDFADEVIINADFAYAMNNLVPEGVLKKYSKEKLAKKKYSCSTFMMYLGLDKIYPELPHHTIVFADDYHKNVDEIFKKFTISEDMSFYLRNSSINDSTVAPEGKSGLYVLVPVPNNSSHVDWNEIKDEYREKILKQIETRTVLKDIRDHIVAERIITPADWENSNIYIGATFNLAHTINQMLTMRPHNKFEELKNCYLVGGGTHPGSGLPTIYESGRITANLIEKN